MWLKFERTEMHTWFLQCNLGESDSLGDLAVNGIILLNCILKRVGECDLGSSGSALCQCAGCCKHDNETSSYVKCRKFLWLGEEVFAFQGVDTIESAYFRDLAFHRPRHTWMA